MLAKWMGSAALLAVLACAGCQDWQSAEPAFSDLQQLALKGDVEWLHTRTYAIEQPADMAALLAAPATWMPPAEMPAETSKGESAQIETRFDFDRNGGLLSRRVNWSTAKGWEMLESRAPSGKGRVALEYSLHMPGRMEMDKRSIGKGDIRYPEPGTQRLSWAGDENAYLVETVYDEHGRLRSNHIVNHNKKKGTRSTEREEVQAYGVDGKPSLTRKQVDDSVRYRTFLRLDKDIHGNPLRTLTRVATVASTDPDPNVLESIELSIMTYGYYDEAR